MRLSARRVALVLTQLLLATGLTGPPAGAEGLEEDVVEADEVVVTATRTPLPLSRVAASVTVLTQDDIRRSPYPYGYQTDDLLRYVPAVQPSNLSSRYNHPTAQAVSLRGLGVRRALVLLDGVPLNDGFGGWINWGLVPDRVERIEIVPGGGSNLYGTWAMGGVINITSQSPRGEPGAAGEASGGNLGTNSQSISGRYGHGPVGLLLAYRHYDTAGYITVPSYQRGPVDGPVDSGHHQFHGGLAFDVGSRTKATISGYYFQEDRTFGTPLSQASRRIGLLFVGLNGEAGRWGDWETKVFAQWQTFTNQTSVIVPSSTVRQSELLERLQIIPSNDYGGMAQWTMPVGASSRLLFGGDVRAILAQSDDRIAIANNQSLVQGKQIGTGLFGEWIAHPVAALTLTAGVRWDYWKSFDGERQLAGAAPLATQDNVASVLNPKLSVQYNATERLRMGASVYQAFRAPTLNELYREFGFAGFTFQANERLAPERLTGTEAKLEADLLPQGRLSLRVTGHYDVVKDQIIFVTLSPASAQRQNVGEARSVGADVELTSRVRDTLLVNLGYSYVDSTITSSPGNPAREGLRIPNVSRHQLVAGVTIGRVTTLQLTVQARYLSRQYADDLNRQPVADFVLLDASLRKRVWRGAELFVNGENLTDRHYIATQTGTIKTLGQPLLVIGGVRIEL